MENKSRGTSALYSGLLISVVILLCLQGSACRGSSSEKESSSAPTAKESSSIPTAEAMKAELRQRQDAQVELARRFASCLAKANEQPASAAKAGTQTQNCAAEVFKVGKDPGGSCSGSFPFECMEICNAELRRAAEEHADCMSHCTDGRTCGYCSHQYQLASATFNGCIWCCALSTGLR
jgi:hypothetical protein